MNAVLRVALFAVIGGALGFGMQKLIGCPSGGCPILRSSTNSILYGAVIGLLMGLTK